MARTPSTVRCRILREVFLLLVVLQVQRCQGRINRPDNIVRYRNNAEQDQQQWQRQRRTEQNDGGDDGVDDTVDDTSYQRYAYPPKICKDGIVQVTSLQTVCDSPYTFYYGNGANRNSESCNYGDKATITAYFDVTSDLYNTNIYMVMSIYAGYGNEVLSSTSPKVLKKYVGYSCNAAGSYSFSYTTTVGSASSGSSSSFVPYVQIAFSSKSNGDYNLGAANIPCNWDDDREWTEIAAMSPQYSAREFFVENGIFICILIACSAFVAVFTKRTLENDKFIQKMRSLRARHAATDKSSALMSTNESTTT